MNQYKCPFCKRWVFYDDDHPCFTFMSEDDAISMPRLEDLDAKGKTYNEAKEGLMEHSNEISAELCSNALQNETEKPEHVYSLPIENKEKLSFTSASNCEGNFRLISERTSKNEQHRIPYPVSMLEFTLNTRANEIHLNENASSKAFQENIEFDCMCQRDFPGAYESTSFVTGSDYEQNKRGAMFSNLFHVKDIDGCGIYMEKNKWQSFNNAKENFIGPLVPVTENASSENTNISGTSGILVNYDVLHLNEKPDNEMIGALGNPKDENIPTEVLSQVQSNIEEMAFNEDKPISSIKEDNAVAGPSRLLPSKKRHACDFCPKQFTRKSWFDRHIRIHPGEKPFVCDLCKNRFATRGNLTAHIRTHTGDKPFVCDVCKRGFALKSNLTTHMAYTRRSTCNDHQRRVHK